MNLSLMEAFNRISIVIKDWVDENKVQKISGKGLSTNDYTTEEKEKLANLVIGAGKNVQSNWDETNETSDAYIVNKPPIKSGSATNSIIEGADNVALGDYSRAEGHGTIATGKAQHVQGEYNIQDTPESESRATYAHIVGNGTSDTTRSNAYTLDWSGNAWYAGIIKVGGIGQDDSEAQELATKEYVNSNKLTVDSALSSTSTNPVQNKVINEAITNLQSLVGETPVSTQISNAIASLSTTPKITTVSILAKNWTGDTEPYSQVVTVNGVTTNSKVDLQPNAAQIVELQNADIMLMTENNDGIVTVYALGGIPENDYTMQVVITEVVAV